uniref:DUF4082 domain-containing protein n=1 Tax=Lapillicoccus sp. TaxID=1909287 RepID=UPI0025E18731
MAPVRTISFRHPLRIVLPTVLALLAGLVGLTVIATASPGEAIGGGYSIWSSGAVPKVAADSDTQRTTLGLRFGVAKAGWIQAIRFYKAAQNTGVHTGYLYSSAGGLLSQVTFAAESSQGWQEATLSQPVAVTAGSTYVAAYTAPAGRYSDDTSTLSPQKTAVHGALTALQGVYTYGTGVPSSTWQSSNYFVDVRYSTKAYAPVPTGPTPTGTTTGPATRPPSPSTTTRPTTSPPTTPPPITTAPSSPRTGCAVRPSGCGYPDASTTGVPAGVTLKNVPGDVRS